MEDKKNKSIAKKIAPNLSKGTTTQSRFDIFIKIIKSQYDEYFSLFSFADIIKIFLYCDSIIKTGDTFKGEQVIKNSYLVGVFTYDSEEFESVSCEDCGGSGEVSCDNCGGSGDVNCSVCDGESTVECNYCDNGEVTCGECNGDGCEECGGTGNVDCPDCEGTENLDCPDCEGSGTESCDYCSGGYISCELCDGSGEMYSEEQNSYYYDLILVPSLRIGDEFSMKEELGEPLPEDYNSENYLKILSGEGYEQFDDRVISGKYYVYGAERLESPTSSANKPFRLNGGKISPIFTL